MLYNQSFCGTGFPNCGQYYPNTINGPGVYGACPEVVGEGDVATVLLPDGTTQFFFLPVTKWSTPEIFNPHLCHGTQSYYNTNYGVWFIRSVSNPIPQSFYRQQNQVIYGFSDPKHSLCCNTNVATPRDYNIKFHNDSWTSTTDLHYFFPCIRSSNVSSKPCVGMQVDMPETKPQGNNTDYLYEVACSKPCHCTPTFRQNKTHGKCACREIPANKRQISSKKGYKKDRTKYHKCECYPETGPKIRSSQSHMSVDEIKPKQSFKDKQKETWKHHTCECVTSLEVDESNSSAMSIDQAQAQQSSKKCKKNGKIAIKKQLASESNVTSDSEISCDIPKSVPVESIKKDNYKNNTNIKKKDKDERKGNHVICICASDKDDTADSSDSKNAKKSKNKKYEKKIKVKRKDKKSALSSKNTEKSHIGRKDTSIGTTTKVDKCDCELRLDKKVDTFPDRGSDSISRTDRGPCCRMASEQAVATALTEITKTEMWFPKTPVAKNAMRIERNLSICDSNSICSCYSDYGEGNM